MLEGVIDHGTARAARGAIKEHCVGKTGLRAMAVRGLHAKLGVRGLVGFDDNKQLA